MCERGVWQLKEVLLRYSETGYSSNGVRFYLKHLLPSWEQRNPQVINEFFEVEAFLR